MAEGNRRPNRQRWLGKLDNVQDKIRSDAEIERDEALARALVDFEKLTATINADYDKLEMELDNYMNKEKEYVESLKEKGEDLPADYPDPKEPKLECIAQHDVGDFKWSPLDPPEVREAEILSRYLGKMSLLSPHITKPEDKDKAS